MEERLTEAIDTWREKVELRNLMTFGDEDISLHEFAELFKNTFEIIRYVKNEFIFKGILPDDIYVTMEYLDLLTVLSKYTTYDCTDDESEDKRFTATCLIAQNLLEYATAISITSFHEDGTTEYYDNDNEAQGILSFYRDDYPFYDDDEVNHEKYVYNIYKEDFREVLELASQL